MLKDGCRDLKTRPGVRDSNEDLEKHSEQGHIQTFHDSTKDKVGLNRFNGTTRHDYQRSPGQLLMQSMGCDYIVVSQTCETVSIRLQVIQTRESAKACVFLVLAIVTPRKTNLHGRDH